ncbi:hypothetical protein M378DRAFT_163405 [Amanita muscaria Koide BX008]|uniref:Uncharacterized protein n=1 Tax=Amanita muscaria (strain Koide BX008) TaxID=946122 RepID=A0A0C2X6K2_AMAMK|nr:hypothetical protein M378DRAFT_163405 [Amanita muscaria Koide BX008]
MSLYRIVILYATEELLTYAKKSAMIYRLWEARRRVKSSSHFVQHGSELQVFLLAYSIH